MASHNFLKPPQTYPIIIADSVLRDNYTDKFLKVKVIEKKKLFSNAKIKTAHYIIGFCLYTVMDRKQPKSQLLEDLK